jgi:hypothetical protein
MFKGDVYYCWSCDAHCRAVPTATSAPTCPRCREHLSEDCRLDESNPPIAGLFARVEPGKKATPVSPGVWPIRAAAMH